MSSVKMHLQKFHEEAADHHSQLSSHHKALATAHKALAKKVDDNDASEAHDKISQSHAEIARRHSDFSEFHKGAADACMKAASGDDLTKANAIRPDGVMRIIPSDNPMSKIRAVPRAGQPELVDRTGVPPELQKFVSLDDVF